MFCDILRMIETKQIIHLIHDLPANLIGKLEMLQRIVSLENLKFIIV